MKQHDGPLPALIASTVVVCVIATIMGAWEVWIPVALAFIVVGSICYPSKR